MAKTTAKHFEIFKRECEKWIEIYGLKNWRVHYFHDTILDDCFAAYKAKVFDRVASLFLSKEWKHEKITKEQIKESAFHEVSHVVLCRLWALAMDRALLERDIDEEIHNLIRVLENTLFKLQ